jgi:secondary thiamine-phosphate synthase enzyme
MSWVQKTIRLAPKKRGFHLITAEVMKEVPELSDFTVGLAHIFIQHTSASLSINENADPTVRTDMETIFNRIVPESSSYVHSDEGPDDMPGHAKAALLGCSVTVPITRGTLNLGTWQGLYLCEHRNSGGARTLVVTLQGQTSHSSGGSSSTSGGSGRR